MMTKLLIALLNPLALAVLVGCADSKDPYEVRLNEWSYAVQRCSNLAVASVNKESETLTVEIYVLQQMNAGHDTQHYQDKVTRMQTEVDALYAKSNRCNKWADSLEPRK
jgi:ribosomal protein L25 (general stress protein Ctc)